MQIPGVTQEYWEIISFMEKHPGMYGSDQRRADCHVELCEHYGLSKEKTQAVTDHLDECEDAEEMHMKLEALAGPTANYVRNA